ncbi:MAG: hypothetical protein ACLFV6_11990 [Spirulinaceae cyanobacterium]
MTTIIDNPQIIQNKLDEIRLRYENLYAISHSEALNSLAMQLFESLRQYINRGLSQDINGLVNSLSLAKNLVIEFQNKYINDYSLEFQKELDRVIDFLDEYYLLFSGLDFLNSSLEIENDWEKISQETQGYQKLAEFIRQYWHHLDSENQEYFSKLAQNIRNKSVFISKENVTQELKRAWQEAKLNIKLTWIGTWRNNPNLFDNYKKAVESFLVAVEEAVKLKPQTLLKSIEENAENNQISIHRDIYNNYWLILEDAKTQFPNLVGEINAAMKETIMLLEKQAYIPEDTCITPLAWLGNQYPQIASYCNNVSRKIIADYPDILGLNETSRKIEGTF